MKKYNVLGIYKQSPSYYGLDKYSREMTLEEAKGQPKPNFWVGPTYIVEIGSEDYKQKEEELKLAILLLQ